MTSWLSSFVYIYIYILFIKYIYISILYRNITQEYMYVCIYIYIPNCEYDFLSLYIQGCIRKDFNQVYLVHFQVYRDKKRKYSTFIVIFLFIRYISCVYVVKYIYI